MARLFLGDVGSLPLGLLIGWLLLLLAARGHLAAALLLPLYYLVDATITLFRRLMRGERVWLAHRTHFYQRATDNGFSVPTDRQPRVAGQYRARCARSRDVLSIESRGREDRRARLRRDAGRLVAAWLSRRQKMTRVLVTGASGFVGRR